MIEGSKIMDNVIQVKKLSKTFKIKLKEKGLKGSLKSIIKPKYKTIKLVALIDGFDVDDLPFY